MRTSGLRCFDSTFGLKASSVISANRPIRKLATKKKARMQAFFYFSPASLPDRSLLPDHAGGFSKGSGMLARSRLVSTSTNGPSVEATTARRSRGT